MKCTFVAPRTKWQFECRDKDGNLKWTEAMDNMVFDAGINHLINAYFKGVNYTAGFFVGLINSGAVLEATDNAVNHPGWTENTSYEASQRPALTLGPTGNKQTDNSTAKALFVMNDAATLGGAFLTTSPAKGVGGGTVYAGAVFGSGDKALAAGDTLAVTTVIAGA